MFESVKMDSGQSYSLWEEFPSLHLVLFLFIAAASLVRSLTA